MTMDAKSVRYVSVGVAGVCFLLGVTVVVAVAPSKSTLTNPLYWLAAVSIAAVASAFTLVLARLGATSQTNGDGRELAVAGRSYDLPGGWIGTAYEAVFGPDGSYRWGISNLYNPEAGQVRQTGVLVGKGSDCRLILEATPVQFQAGQMGQVHPQPQSQGQMQMPMGGGTFDAVNTIMELKRQNRRLQAQLEELRRGKPPAQGPQPIELSEVMGSET
jgi:hypothetical protein